MRKYGEESSKMRLQIIKIIFTDFITNKICSLNTTGLRERDFSEVIITSIMKWIVMA
jgi:hypothetical protein